MLAPAPMNTPNLWLLLLAGSCLLVFGWTRSRLVAAGRARGRTALR